jgi:hypothetical protein
MPNPASLDSIGAQSERARDMVKEAVANSITELANIVALTLTDARFDHFREEVTAALHTCMRIHILAPIRTYERAADLRKDFEALADEASEAAKKLYAVQDVLDRLPPMNHNPAFRLVHPPFSVTFELEGLAEEARKCAEVCVDPGGATRMRAFRALVQGLEQAVQHATGQPAKVNWNAHRDRYEGKFFDVVDAVWPTAHRIAKVVTGRLLPAPETAVARGKFLQRLNKVSLKDITRHK